MPETLMESEKVNVEEYIAQLQQRLAEAEDILRAIRNGEIDALLDPEEESEQIYTLQGADSLYRLFVEEMVQGAVTMTPQGLILFCNRRFSHSLNWPQEKIAGHSFGSFVNPAEQAAFEKLLSRSAGGSCQGEINLRDLEGKLISFELALNPLWVDGSEVICMVATDLTERKQALEALQRSASTNQALLKAIPDVMLRISHEGILLNFKAEKEFGLPLPFQKALGQSISTIFSQDNSLANLFMNKVSATFETGQIQIFEYQLMLKTKVGEYEARGVVSGPNEVMILIRDITERKKVEALKNEFVSTVSHELRTPLTSIRGSLGLVLGGITGSLLPQTRTMVEIAYKNTERLVRLINDILDIEKIESGKLVFDMQAIEIGPIIEQALEANRAYGQEYGVRFELIQLEKGLNVQGDSDRLTQVLTNLLSNAAKFSPRGSVVEVVVGQYKTGQLRVSVRDRGQGVPLDFQTRMFQKFAQADNSDTRQKGGSGLGLSIARAIVETHGGRLGFETKPGAGSIFYFDLPLGEAPHLPLMPSLWPTSARF